jgi:DNA-binding transcriptional MerR regulator
MKITFAAKEVQEILEIERSRIQFYIGERLFEPESSGKGKGVRRKFTKRNIIEIHLIMELFKLGLQKDQIGFLVNYIQLKDEKFERQELASLISPESLPETKASLCIHVRTDGEIGEYAPEISFVDPEGNQGGSQVVGTPRIKVVVNLTTIAWEALLKIGNWEELQK